MYLDAKIYLSKMSNDKEILKKRESIREMFPEITTTGNLDYIEICFEAGYWRKANAIHQWFVEHVQYGEDECRPHSVSREELKGLLDSCIKVKNDHTLADELLPTQDGFFFGGTEYDEYYFVNIDATIKIVEYALSLPDEYDFEYHSIW